VLARTSDPDEARVRFTIARLEGDEQNLEGLTTTFTRYVNYVTRTQTSPITGDSSEQPTYDSGGSVVPLDSSAGTYLYIFGTALPEGFPASLTHTVGAQIERTFDERDLVANPTSDFVPDGGPVSVVREPTTTAQCNSCHNPLALHGSGRREVSLCKLCHTSQAVDPDTGNTIEFAPMVHSIHRGRELPSVDGGVVGTKYSIIGYRQSEHVYAERVQACEGGPFASAVCTSDADCGEGGTCTDEKTAGVGFPQDLRNCGKCHTDGSTAANHLENPSSSACVGCHDNVNPSLVETGAGPPGFLHLAGPQPEAACRLCHVAQGPEFGISVAGAHTIPARSQQLAGLEAEILSAVGAPGGSLQMEFRILDGGAPVSDIGGAGLNRIAIALSGPNTDFGAFDPPLIRPTVFGSGSSGVLSGPDPLGVFTYETDETLPEDAYGTWRVGLEARRSVELLDPFGAAAASATEAVQNPVLDFSVDGSPLAPRREVAGMDNCGECHGTFSKGFNIHGSLRNQSDYCVICHNPSMSDFARRNPAVTDENASVVNEPIGFKHMIHKIHTGEELESKPYIIYGFGFPFTPHEFSEVRFPGNRADCATCHVNDSHLLPLDEGLLPTLQTIVDAGTELVVGSIPVIQDACLACHGSMEAQAHADTYTSELGEESCGNCHNEGAFKAVSEVHAHHLD
jgi:OmcA/MtrC family decaheme c-type cytochrome